MMTTHGLKRRTRRVWAAAAAAVLGVGALTGCAPDIGGLLESAIEDAVNSEGGDIDIEFNDGGISIEGSENGEEFAIDLGAGGDSCAPGWVAVPQGDVIFAQRLVSGEGEVCVTGWMVAGTPDDVPRRAKFARQQRDRQRDRHEEREVFLQWHRDADSVSTQEEHRGPRERGL